MDNIDEKNYLSIREAAEKMGYTRQYVYRALSNRFKDYLKIINGEKKLHVDVLKMCNHVNIVGDKLVTMVTDKNKFNNTNDYNKTIINEKSNRVNIAGDKLGDKHVTMITDKTENNYIHSSNYGNCNQVNSNGYNEVDFFHETISVLKQQLLMKDKQLDEKDKQLQVKDGQINTLQNELNLQNKHARQQSDRLVGLIEQVNELQRNNQVLLAQKDIKNKEIEEQKENKGMFKWFFKKNNN